MISSLQDGTLRNDALGHIAPQRNHVLDNVAKAALELELIIPRATLQPLGLRANTAVPKRLSQGVLKTPVGNGDDHDPAPCDGAAPPAGGAL